MPEIIGASDRIMVLNERKLLKEYGTGDVVTQEDIMRSAAGA